MPPVSGYVRASAAVLPELIGPATAAANASSQGFGSFRTLPSSPPFSLPSSRVVESLLVPAVRGVGAVGQRERHVQRDALGGGERLPLAELLLL